MGQATEALPVMMMKATWSHGRVLWESWGGGGQEDNEEIISQPRAQGRAAATAQGESKNASPEPAFQQQEAPYSTEHDVLPRDIKALSEGQITGHLVMRAKYSESKASGLAPGRLTCSVSYS